LEFLTVDFQGLGLLEQRNVREVINTPQGAIEIYEPNIDDVSKIIDLQKDMGFGMESATVMFEGVAVIRDLFPLLTNIDFGDMTDEQMENVINKPSIHLLITQQIVAQIVAESNKLYAQRIKTELMNTESTIAQMELLNQIPAMIVDRAKRDGKVAELMNNVERLSDELDEAVEREEAEAKIDGEQDKVSE